MGKKLKKKKKTDVWKKLHTFWMKKHDVT